MKYKKAKKGTLPKVIRKQLKKRLKDIKHLLKHIKKMRKKWKIAFTIQKNREQAEIDQSNKPNRSPPTTHSGLTLVPEARILKLDDGKEIKVWGREYKVDNLSKDPQFIEQGDDINSRFGYMFGLETLGNIFPVSNLQLPKIFYEKLRFVEAFTIKQPTN